MALLPDLGVSLLVRTDFRSDAAWAQVCEEAARPSEDGFEANFSPVSDPDFDGADWPVVKAAVPSNDHGAMVVFIADSTTLSDPDHPILVVDLMDWEGEHLEPFRCIPAELWAVENNLNLANMDWADFARAADEQRVFRGFD